MNPELAVVLHDVEPATWSACQRVIDAVGDIAALPVTLALVAETGSAVDDDAFGEAMLERLECGDELALQGGGPTRGGDEAALASLALATRWFAARGWPLHGLVTQRQTLSVAFRQALAGLPLSYASAPRRLYMLPDGELLQSRSLAYSSEGVWDRLASLGRNAMHDRTAPDAEPLLRFELHPRDADDAMLRRDWQRRLAWHLQYRHACTVADVIQRWHCEPTPA